VTHEEELEFLKACGAKLSELTADKILGTAMVMFFPSKRIHCISNLEPSRAQSLLAHYVASAHGENGSAYVRESAWLHMSYRQVDGVSTSSVLGASSTKALAEAWLSRQAEPSKDRCYGIEEVKVDCDD
jgi:hypothetical protein